MSNLPIIESIYATSPYERPGSKKHINSYYEGFLNQDDAAWIAGMDDAGASIDNAFCTLEDAEGFEYTNFDISKIDSEKLQQYMETDYDPFEEYDADELSALSNETKIAMLFYKHIREILWENRNDAGIGFIENMDDSDLQYNKEEFFKDFEESYENFLEFCKREESPEAYKKMHSEARKVWEEEEMNEKAYDRLKEYQEKMKPDTNKDDTKKRFEKYAEKMKEVKNS